MRNHVRPTVLLTIAYIAALAVIGLLSVSAHLMVGSIIAEQRDEGAVLNATGRQRMLSQRIAYLSERLMDNSTPLLRREMSGAIAQMEQVHRNMVRGNAGAGFPEQQPRAVAAILFSSPHELDRRVKTFLNFARTFTAESSIQGELSVRDPGFQFIRAEAAGPLLESFEALVSAYEAHFLEMTDRLLFLQRILLGVVILTLLGEGMLIFRPLVRRVHLYAANMHKMALSDPMTGIGNRRAFYDAAEDMLERAEEKNRPLGLALLDIDRFKLINDREGHAVGDEAICHLARVTGDIVRRDDVLCRLGGEEFAILLPGADLAETRHIAERVRQGIEATVLQLEDGRDLPFTVSVGFAVCFPESRGAAVTMAHRKMTDHLLNSADEALYRAKNGGRNRIAGPFSGPRGPADPGGAGPQTVSGETNSAAPL